MRLVTIRPQDGGALFEKEMGVKPEQLRPSLGSIGWLKLHGAAKNETVLVLTRAFRPVVEFKADGAKSAVKVTLPEPFAMVLKEKGLKHPPTATDVGGYKAEVNGQLQGRDLTVRLRYTYETPREVQEAAEALEKGKSALQNAEAPLPGLRKTLESARAAYNKAREPVAAAEKACEEAVKTWKDTEEERAKGKAKRQVEAAEDKLKQARQQHGTKIEAEKGPMQKAQKALDDAEQRVKEAKGKLEKETATRNRLEGAENTKRQQSFGRFPKGLELEAAGQVVVVLETNPPDVKK